MARGQADRVWTLHRFHGAHLTATAIATGHGRSLTHGVTVLDGIEG